MTEVPAIVGSRSRRILLIVGAALITIIVLLVLASIAEHVFYSGSILPGVRIADLRVGGDNDTQVRAAIMQLKNTLETEPLHAHAGRQTFEVDPSLIGFSVDTDATIRAARDAGRDSNLFGLVSDTVLRRFRSEHVPLVVHYDDARFEGLLDGWTSALQAGLVEGTVRIQGTTVTGNRPHAGRGLLRDEAAAALRRVLSSTSRPDLELPVGDVSPHIDQAAVDAAVTRARALLRGTFVVTAGTLRATLTPAQLAVTLGTTPNGHTLDLTIDPVKLRFVLGPALGAVEQAALEATWNISNANAVTVVPSRDGRQIDLEAVGNAILANRRAITARIRAEHPAHDTAWATALGITHQVSSFTTRYLAGQPRVHNIHLAADILNNTVVASAQTFSLNAKLGQRTAAKGYVQAPVELEDGFGQDYGGGISQLTTTLYNAVFFGGYVDVDHSPHHYYVSRYPLGREATIVWPYVDLKFRNDTKHGVLIRTSYSDTSITVTFYGNTDGRVATEINRKILHTDPITDRLVPCPAAKPADDPNGSCARLLPLERVMTATGETGYDVEFDRLITQPGRPPVQTHYQVHYPMLQNTVLVGTVGSATTTTSTITPSTTAPSTTATKPASPTTAHH